MYLDTWIQPGVNPAEAYRLVIRSRGMIAAALRMQALRESDAMIRDAHRTTRGGDRHRRVKRARDVKRHIRRLEMERMGWR